ncbi:MAG TPA: polysaccharide biosynthesis tyrosine autokinase [Gammaproteobacteria bacterium]|nr:polysaccharide biosynthesis tyrosine autokinase [Gammaproteobacteria bacterium]
MERIKQALERARAERAGQPAPAGATQAAAPAVTPVEQVTYSQTRHIEVSRPELREKRVITGFDPCEFTDAYKMLRTQVLQRLNENDWNVLAITSPGTGEGKTLTALNLAASLALEVSYTVLLVDANLRHPSLHEHLGLPGEPGLSDYLMEDTPLPELLVHPKGIDHLTILPGGRPLLNSAEMLNSPKMTRLVDELKNRYAGRIVIFDLPPVLDASDAMAFSPYVDATLLVVEEGKTTKKEVERAVDMLASTNILGTVLNKSGKD